MKLIDYISSHYNGSVKSFANDNGIKHRQQVEQMIVRGNYHVIEIDGLVTVNTGPSAKLKNLKNLKECSND